MELQQYIRELLFRHDCIMLPEFGGFVANYRPAEINYITHTFSPPSKDIVFNAELKDNDGLLIGYISRKSGMSYVDARKWLDKQIRELTRKLEKGKKIYLEDIGTFHLGKDKNLLFEPAKSVNYLTETYGLADFHFSPLQDMIKQKKERSGATSSGINKTWRWVAVAVPLIAVLTLIPVKTNWLDNIHIDLSTFNPFQTKKVIDENHPAGKINGEEEIRGSSLEKTKPEDQPVSEAVQANESTEDIAPEQDKTTPPVYKYFIVAGSFQHRSNAEVMKSRLAGEGKDATIMEGPQGFFRVVYGDYTEKVTAQHELSDVRQIHGQENFWLLRK